jgi:hypothetical protein
VYAFRPPYSSDFCTTSKSAEEIRYFGKSAQVSEIEFRPQGGGRLTLTSANQDILKKSTKNLFKAKIVDHIFLTCKRFFYEEVHLQNFSILSAAHAAD